MPKAQSVAPLFDAVFRSPTPPLDVRRQSLRRHASRGFSLVELLIVLGVMLTITALAVPHLMAALDDARIARAAGEIHSIEVNITIYQATNNGNLPADLSQIEATSLVDPWGHPYQYFNHASGTGNGGILRQDLFLVSLNEDYDLYSLGKDGLTATTIGTNVSQDDVIRAGSGGYTGVASQF